MDQFASRPDSSIDTVYRKEKLSSSGSSNSSHPRTHVHHKKDRISSGSLAYEEARSAKMRRNSDFVYENPAFTGSATSVNQTSIPMPPTHVVREQYWACSRWPAGQRLLAIAVGVLIGAVIGLAVAVGMIRTNDTVLTTFLRSSHSAPD